MASFEELLADLVSTLNPGSAQQAAPVAMPPQRQTSAPGNAMLAAGQNPAVGWIEGPNRFGGEMRSYDPSVGEVAGGNVNRMLAPYIGSGAERVGSAVSNAMTYGPVPAQIATDIAMQPVRAGNAVGNAMTDPTLANVTNAGVQTGMALLRPAAAVGSLALGYGEALRRDIGGGSAQAQSRRKQATPEYTPAELPGLTPQQNAEYNEARKRISESAFRSGADRRMLESTVTRYSDLSADFMRRQGEGQLAIERQRKAAEQEEYNRAVERAEAARDFEMSRDRRFSDTEVGKLWEQTGGLAPMAAGIATGVIARAASGGGSAANNYLKPGLEGGAAGVAAANVPLGYNALFTEPDNPERRAYEAYARELPQSHPRRQEFSDYARSLPEANPVRSTAATELYDPVKFGERAVMGGVEGVLGGLIGAGAVRTAGRPYNAMMSATRGKPPPTAAAPSPQREVIRERVDKNGRRYRINEQGRRVTLDESQP